MKPVLTTLLFLLLAPRLFSQEDSAVVNPGIVTIYQGPVVYSFPLLDHRPYLTSDMPLDVLIAYIIADSTARTTNVGMINAFIERQISTDSLLLALRYDYVMSDFDPILYTQWAGGAPSGTYKCPPAYIREMLAVALYKTHPAGKLLSLLLASDIIAHVSVEAVDTTTDTSAKWARHANAVTCTIVDIIKGQTLPLCEVPSSPRTQTTAMYKQAADAGACFQFDYRDEWFRFSKETDFGPERTMAGWVQPNTEYIVFLQFIGIPGDPSDYNFTNNNWLSLIPTFCSMTATGSLFPIQNGIVIDPDNDFGFGQSLTPSEWKNALRQVILQVKNAGL